MRKISGTSGVRLRSKLHVVLAVMLFAGLLSVVGIGGLSQASAADACVNTNSTNNLLYAKQSFGLSCNRHWDRTIDKCDWKPEGWHCYNIAQAANGGSSGNGGQSSSAYVAVPTPQMIQVTRMPAGGSNVIWRSFGNDILKVEVYRNNRKIGEVNTPGTVYYDNHGGDDDSYRVVAVTHDLRRSLPSAIKQTTAAAPYISGIAMVGGRADMLQLEWLSLNDGKYSDRFFEVQINGAIVRQVNSSATQMAYASTTHRAGIKVNKGKNLIRVRVADYGTTNYSPWSKPFVLLKIEARGATLGASIEDIGDQINDAEQDALVDNITAAGKGGILVVHSARPGTPLDKGIKMANAGRNFSDALDKAKASNKKVEDLWDDFQKAVKENGGPELPDPAATDLDNSVNVDRMHDIYDYVDSGKYRGKSDDQIRKDLKEIMERYRKPRPPSYACQTNCPDNSDPDPIDGPCVDNDCQPGNEPHVPITKPNPGCGENDCDNSGQGGQLGNDEQDEQDEEEKDDTPTENPHTK